MLAKLTTLPAFALIAATAKAHYYSHSDGRLDAEIQKIYKKTTSVYDAINDKAEADSRAGHTDSILESVLAAEAKAAASMADKVLVTAALAEIEQALAAIEVARAAAEAAQLASEVAQEESETAQTGAETAQTAAQTAQGLAETAARDAETAQGATTTARQAADAAQAAAELAKMSAQTSATQASGYQTATEAAQSAAEDFLSQVAASAVLADGSAVTSAGNAMTAMTNAETAAMNATTADINATDAQTAETNAAAAVTTATSQKWRSLYNSWGTIEDNDYDFQTYAIWVEGQKDKFKWASAQGFLLGSEVVGEEIMTDNILFAGDTFSGQCQQYYEDECHGTGEFVRNGTTYYVHFHKGRVFRVYENQDGNDEVYTCNGNGPTKSCDNYHGPYSKSGKQGGDVNPRENYMYNEYEIMGYSTDVTTIGTMDADNMVFFQRPSNEQFPLQKGALNNWCAYIDVNETDNLTSDSSLVVENYCGASLL